jgi:pSer/pThr/pTyr-binding forkhead associated (FHA) protein
VAVLRGQRRDIALARGMRATIGRDRACDISFDDEALSRRTCELRVTDAGAAFIEDLHSACGTVVNDARTAGPYRLHERDAIRIGSTLMVFQNAVQD